MVMPNEAIRAQLVAVTDAALDLLCCLGKPAARSEHWQTWNHIDGLPGYVAEAPITSEPDEIRRCLRNLERVAREAGDVVGGE